MLPAMSEPSERIVVTASDERRRRFPGIGDGWARFDGPAGTQMVDRAIDADGDVVGERQQRQLRWRVRRRGRRATSCSTARGAPSGALFGADPAGVVFGANMTTLTFAFTRAVGDDVASRRPRRRHPPRPRRQRHAVAHRRATGPAPSTCSPRSTRPPAGSIRGGHRPDRRAHQVGGRHRRVEPPRHHGRPGADRRRRPRRWAPGSSSTPCTSPRTARSTSPRSAATCSSPAPTSGTARTPACCAATRRCSTRCPSPRSVRPPTRGPRRWETGTSNFEAIAAIAAAAEFLLEEGLDRIGADEARVRRQLLDGLGEIGGVRLWGPATMDDRVPTVAFTVDGQHPDEVAAALAAGEGRDVEPGTTGGRDRRPTRARRLGWRRARRRRRLHRRRRRRAPAHRGARPGLTPIRRRRRRCGRAARRRGSSMTSRAAKFSATCSAGWPR